MIEKVFITSFICTLIYVALRPGMVFEIIGEVMEIFMHPLVSKPLGLCLTCMSSVYGTILFYFWSGLPWHDYLPFILAVGGINHIISKYINYEAQTS